MDYNEVKSRNIDIKLASDSLERMKTIKEKCAKIINESSDSLRVEIAKETITNLIDLINHMCKYTTTVFEHERFLQQRPTETRQVVDKEDRERLNDKAKTAESKRSGAHDLLISKIKFFNDNCDELGIEMVYDDIPEKYKNNVGPILKKDENGNDRELGNEEKNIRHKIAFWAWDTVLTATVAFHVDYDWFKRVDYVSNKEDTQKLSEAYNNPGKVGGEERAVKFIVKNFID